MSGTGPVDSWVADPSSLGPIYPFVGWELLMYGLSLAFCLAFLAWKVTTETLHYRERVAQLHETDELAEALGVTSAEKAEGREGGDS